MNHIDIAPNFAGTLMGITNCAANIMSIIAPLLVGFVVYDQSNPAQWRYVFFISAGVYFFGNLMFIFFSKTDVQPWNDPDHRGERKIHIYVIIQFELFSYICLYMLGRISSTQQT